MLVWTLPPQSPPLAVLFQIPVILLLFLKQFYKYPASSRGPVIIASEREADQFLSCVSSIVLYAAIYINYLISPVRFHGPGA
jgi:hypothetical protein